MTTLPTEDGQQQQQLNSGSRWPHCDLLELSRSRVELIGFLSRLEGKIAWFGINACVVVLVLHCYR